MSGGATRLIDRLIAAAAPEWRAYTQHPFVEAMAAGTLPEPAFRHYLVQDYLFLVQFARAYALAAYKARTVEEMRAGLKGLAAILDMEMELHLRYCAGWGLDRSAVQTAEEDTPTVAYSRFVLDAGLQGDLLDLHVALAPCTYGYAETARRLAGLPGALDARNPYAPWIAEYAGEAYQAMAASTAATLDVLGPDIGARRFGELVRLFSTACRLEAAFWQMGLDKL